MDQEEYDKTLHCLCQPITRLLIEQLRTICTRPVRFVRALGMSLRMALHSERGLFRHLAYLVEASYLLRILRINAVEHVHVHFGTNGAAVARLIKCLGGPGYSFTVHGPDEFDAPRAIKLGDKATDAEFVVAISHYCAAQLRRWVCFKQWAKIHIVRCGVGGSFLSAPITPVDASSRTLVCVGRLCPQKGQLLLVDALAKVLNGGVDCRLVLAGDGEMRATIEQHIEALGIGRRVEITGWIDEEEVRRQIVAAKAMVLPSLAEGLPVVIMEALALGRPVVSTFVAGIPELVVPGQTGWLVPAGDTEQLAEAMRTVLAAPCEMVREMGARGRDRVLEYHSVATETAKLERLFMKHVSATRRTGLTNGIGKVPDGF
jgi:glycosyltransferase involved in cell wall biosynthesis